MEFFEALEMRTPTEVRHGPKAEKDEVQQAIWNAVLAKVDSKPELWAKTIENLFKNFDRDGSGELVRRMRCFLAPLF